MQLHYRSTWIAYGAILLLTTVLPGCAIQPINESNNTNPPSDHDGSSVVIIRDTKYTHSPMPKKQQPHGKLPVENGKKPTKSVAKPKMSNHTVASTHFAINTQLRVNRPYVIKPYTEHRILFIGDSHSAAIFGKTLTNLLEKRTPARVTTVASCGSSPSWWLDGKPTRCGFWQHNANGSEEKSSIKSTPQITGLINSVKPDTIIVALGTNLIPENKTVRQTYAEELMKIVTKNSQQCFWIGPPDARKFTYEQIDSVYQLLNSLSHKYHCHLVDSRNYIHYPSTGGDGIHYRGTSGQTMLKRWAEQVWQNIHDG